MFNELMTHIQFMGSLLETPSISGEKKAEVKETLDPLIDLYVDQVKKITADFKRTMSRDE